MSHSWMLTAPNKLGIGVGEVLGIDVSVNILNHNKSRHDGCERFNDSQPADDQAGGQEFKTEEFPQQSHFLAWNEESKH